MRRKQGTLLPIEISILESGLELHGRQVAEFYGFLIAKHLADERAHGTHRIRHAVQGPFEDGGPGTSFESLGGPRQRRNKRTAQAAAVPGDSGGTGRLAGDPFSRRSGGHFPPPGTSDLLDDFTEATIRRSLRAPVGTALHVGPSHGGS